METIKKVLHPIHKEGHPFIAIFIGITIIFWLFSDVLFWIGFVLTLWCVYFFRDPKRAVPTRVGLVVSPGDGLVSKIEQVTPPKELGMEEKPMNRISIFLSVFDVHVNRIPIAGKVEKLYYHAGKFLNASLDKASEENERQSIWIKTADGENIAVTQIAGLIARRIVCNLENDQQVETGERFGIIRFGSRVDVYLPSSVKPLVIEGQRAVGGETVLADLKTTEETRSGKII